MPDPSVASRTALGALIHDLGVRGFAEVHEWSVAHPDQFWQRAWSDLGIVGDVGEVVMMGEGLVDTRFFPRAHLNIVDTLLAGPDGDEVVVALSEAGQRVALSRAELREEVATCAAALTAAGVVVGDRVAAWTPNNLEAVVFALGALAVGAIVSTASPDFGPAAIIDRFGQVEPKVLMLAAHYDYAGRRYSCVERIPEILAGLRSVTTTVVVGSEDGSQQGWSEWLAPHRGAPLRTVPLPFEHPGFILFSSGTTGRPKCIMHSAAGVLLKVLSEQVYHLDVHRGDRLLYFTTCGWMMWNWLMLGLGTGAAIVLYDGSPAYPSVERLFDIAEREALTFLGLSAKFIDSVRKSRAHPAEQHDLSALRTIASTGSPLSRENFDFLHDAVSSTAHLASISGGTDICGCFVAGVPTEPVRRGEIQGPTLGLDVQVFNDDGSVASAGTTGELVCRTAFPSVPIGFWGDDGSRFRAAYFERFTGIWAHGDFARRTSSGGFEILGRSDATLNANGVRIGTAEIYRVVESFDEVAEALAVGQAWEGDSRIVLFVTMSDGCVLDDDLVARIRARLREQASPRHVPAVIAVAPALPRTRSNKIAELAVADAVNGRLVRDTSALANPEALDWFVGWAGRG